MQDENKGIRVIENRNKNPLHISGFFKAKSRIRLLLSIYNCTREVSTRRQDIASIYESRYLIRVLERCQQHEAFIKATLALSRAPRVIWQLNPCFKLKMQTNASSFYTEST